MIDNTDSTDNTGIVSGADPGSWVGVTGTLPADLPAANVPGSPQQLAAAAAGGVVPPGGMSTGMSSSTKLALAIGAGAVLLGLFAVATPRRRR